MSDELGTVNMGVISLKLINLDVTPRIFQARPLPFKLKEKFEWELDRLVNLGVLTPVDYSSWDTPFFPVLRKDSSARICGDFLVTINPL